MGFAAIGTHGDTRDLEAAPTATSTTDSCVLLGRSATASTWAKPVKTDVAKPQSCPEDDVEMALASVQTADCQLESKSVQLHAPPNASQLLNSILESSELRNLRNAARMPVQTQLAQSQPQSQSAQLDCQSSQGSLQ